MKKLLEVKLGTGSDDKVFVEVEDLAGVTRSGSSGVDGIIQASETLEESLKKVTPVLQSISSLLREINNPKEIAVEIGFKFTAKAGIIISSIDAEASLKVTLKWQNTP
jgi:Trypsin-co-occurring domain 1